FAKCFAYSSGMVLKSYNNPIVIEVGAGLGTFAVDYFNELLNLNIHIKKYYILELSSDLRQVQQNLIKESFPCYFESFEWITQLPQNSFNGIVIANEVLDAMPVKRFEKTDSGLKELVVTAIDDEKLAFDKIDPSDDLCEAVQKIESDVDILRDPYISEVNLWIQPWLSSLAKCLNEGVILLCDYGYSRREYYHPQRNMGTLQCYFRHQAHDDPLILTGLQDITAHVDFTCVAEAAESCGLDIEGYTTQSFFLAENNLEYYLNELITENNWDAQKAQAIKKLVMPSDMGEVFKVIALSKDYEGEVTGFDTYDFTHVL
ncbi:SAM-dependent methyltransferase, partial [Francisellaceae bacterium]|nr:SAM-dependent methyltransferase [Francisellaceae bacterium]